MSSLVVGNCGEFNIYWVFQRFTLPRLHWMGHVHHMPNSRIPKDLLCEELATGRRPARWPQLRYRNVVKCNMKAVDRVLGEPGSHMIKMERNPDQTLEVRGGEADTSCHGKMGPQNAKWQLQQTREIFIWTHMWPAGTEIVTPASASTVSDIDAPAKQRIRMLLTVNPEDSKSATLCYI